MAYKDDDSVANCVKEETNGQTLARGGDTGANKEVYKTPWQGDPRVNIQNDKGKAKAYQVKQVLAASTRLSEEQKNVN